MIAALIFLGISVVCRACAELQNHGKLRGMKDDDSFTGERSHYRKYANPLDAPKENWYYKFFKIGYRERFLFSSTLFIAFTDFYHLMQFIYHILLSLSVALLTDINFFIVWGSVVGIHSLTYKLLQR